MQPRRYIHLHVHLTLTGPMDAVRLQFANYQVNITMKEIYTFGKMPENFQTPTCQRRKT